MNMRLSSFLVNLFQVHVRWRYLECANVLALTRGCRVEYQDVFRSVIHDQNVKWGQQRKYIWETQKRYCDIHDNAIYKTLHGKHILSKIHDAVIHSTFEWGLQVDQINIQYRGPAPRKDEQQGDWYASGNGICICNGDGSEGRVPVVAICPSADLLLQRTTWIVHVVRWKRKSIDSRAREYKSGSFTWDREAFGSMSRHDRAWRLCA